MPSFKFRVEPFIVFKTVTTFLGVFTVLPKMSLLPTLKATFLVTTIHLEMSISPTLKTVYGSKVFFIVIGHPANFYPLFAHLG